MADLNFPKDRTELVPAGTGPLQTGDTYTDAGTTWVYNADAGVWGSGQGSVTNETYLRLDASNDPVTGTCEFAAGVKVTGGDNNYDLRQLILLSQQAAALWQS